MRVTAADVKSVQIVGGGQGYVIACAHTSCPPEVVAECITKKLPSTSRGWAAEKRGHACDCGGRVYHSRRIVRAQ